MWIRFFRIFRISGFNRIKKTEKSKIQTHIQNLFFFGFEPLNMCMFLFKKTKILRQKHIKAYIMKYLKKSITLRYYHLIAHGNYVNCRHVAVKFKWSCSTVCKFYWTLDISTIFSWKQSYINPLNNYSQFDYWRFFVLEIFLVEIFWMKFDGKIFKDKITVTKTIFHRMNEIFVLSLKHNFLKIISKIGRHIFYIRLTKVILKTLILL